MRLTNGKAASMGEYGGPRRRAGRLICNPTPQLVRCPTLLERFLCWSLLTTLLSFPILGNSANGQSPTASLQSSDELSDDGLNLATEASKSLDRVLIRRGITDTTNLSVWTPLKQTELVGRVIHMDATELVMEVLDDQGDGQPKQLRIPNQQLVAVHPIWEGEGTAEVVALFETQKYREYIQSLGEQKLSAIPRWQQLLLLDMVVRAIDAVQGPAAAGQHFLSLAETAPDMLYSEMPLCWTAIEPDAELVRKSRVWLESPNEVAQLMGASWLLQTADSQQARDVILRLQRSQKSVVAQLATAQSWRIVPPPKTMEFFPNWLTYRDRMLPPLAIGPTEFLADRLARIGQADLAAGQWLWIASHYPDRHNRTKRALAAAVDLVRSSGRDDEADRIANWLNNLHGSSE